MSPPEILRKSINFIPRKGNRFGQGRIPPAAQKSILSATDRQPLLQWELWQLAVAHAMQGILDFVNIASYPAKQQGVSTGVVLFPDGNQKL